MKLTKKAPPGAAAVLNDKLDTIISNQKIIIETLNKSNAEAKENSEVEAFLDESLEVFKSL